MREYLRKFRLCRTQLAHPGASLCNWDTEKYPGEAEDIMNFCNDKSPRAKGLFFFLHFSEDDKSGLQGKVEDLIVNEAFSYTGIRRGLRVQGYGPSKSYS